MNTPLLRKKIDEFSYQIDTGSDTRFWFRLVRQPDRDLITDFFLGSFPDDDRGRLLIECYRVLDLAPRPVVVFNDVLAGRETSAEAVEQARAAVADAASSLFAEHGAIPAGVRVENAGGRINVVLTSRPAPDAR
jgi:hypothetical protein